MLKFFVSSSKASQGFAALHKFVKRFYSISPVVSSKGITEVKDDLETDQAPLIPKLKVEYQIWK